jgi:hypothetical protein
MARNRNGQIRQVTRLFTTAVEHWSVFEIFEPPGPGNMNRSQKGPRGPQSMPSDRVFKPPAALIVLVPSSSQIVISWPSRRTRQWPDRGRRGIPAFTARCTRRPFYHHAFDGAGHVRLPTRNGRTKAAAASADMFRIYAERNSTPIGS